MSQEIETLMPHDLINAKPVTAVVKEYFGSSQLSQFMDQTNPLSEVTHKRRLSALGPGGLTRERAGFEVRDVHPTHYGRICPIETPEGPNIGLIASLSHLRPRQRVRLRRDALPQGRGRPGHRRRRALLSALEEEGNYIAQANATLDDEGPAVREHAGVVAPQRRRRSWSTPDEITLMDVSPNQLVSVAASLIPFLEHDDANRALMGSNMQRQAVPLIRTARAAGRHRHRGASWPATRACAVVAKRDGVVESVDAARIVVKRVRASDDDAGRQARHLQPDQVPALEPEHLLQPEAHRPARATRSRPATSSPTARATETGELALGQNVVVAFMPWGGYNFEDSILRQRAHRQGRRLHLGAHRGVRVRRPRHQARQGRDHPRHPERRRGGAQGPRRVGHRAHRRRGQGRRHPGRQDHARRARPSSPPRRSCSAPSSARRPATCATARCACRRA